MFIFDFMSLYIASINSGSNANCYYVGNEQEAVLIDAGLSCRETEKRMKQLGLPIENIKAIFISHEHSDHITGVPGLSKKFQLPVYITAPTYQNSNIPVEPSLLNTFTKKETFSFGRITVIPFSKQHDAADPYSFVITDGTTTIGVMTDIGYACKQVLTYFKKCDAVFLESNYCPALLENGNYPWHLKKRISSDQGHLSNQQALELFRDYRSPHLQLLILSHLSKNNNNPALVESLFLPIAGNTKIVVASRYAASAVFKISGATPFSLKKETGLSRKVKQNPQLSLF